MKKNGFISTALIYTFFIIFLLLMIFLLNSYSRVRFLLEEFKYDIKESFASESVADLNLYFRIYNNATSEYETVSEMPTFGYIFDEFGSYCKNGSTIEYVNNRVSVITNRKDTCYAYFTEADSDVLLDIYTLEIEGGKRVRVRKIPDAYYAFSKYKCTNNATLEFDEEARKFIINSTKKTKCEAEFVRQNYDIILNIYKESATGSHTYEIDGMTKRFEKTEDLPGVGFTFASFKCANGGSVVYQNDELFVKATKKDTCDAYFVGGEDKVEIIIMQESKNGVSGYTTGKTYTRVYSIPGANYGYVGYICDNKNAEIKYENGMFSGKSDSQTTCRVYFNEYKNNNALINYYLETDEGKYENVISVPSQGYKYSHGKCKNNSNFEVKGNYVVVTTSSKDEVCDFYFNHIDADVKILVYVLNRATGKYELGDIPIAGYEMFGKECTNGASVEYKNGRLDVSSKNPTVCTVYFR